MSDENDTGVEDVVDAEYTGGSSLAVANASDFDSPGSNLAKSNAPVKTAWVGYFGPATKGAKDALNAAGVELNQFYLQDEAGPLKVKPFEYHLLRAKRYYTKQDKAGKVIDVLDKEPRGKTQYKEHLIALVLVVSKSTMGGLKLTPATWSVRSGLCKAINPAINLVLPGGAANDEKEWAARSEKHAISAQAKYPGGRFIVRAWGTPEITLDGENEYNLGHQSISVTSAEGVAAFNKAMTDDFASKIIPATRSWDFRCAAMEKMIAQAA